MKPVFKNIIMALSLLAVMACSSDENFSNKGYNASNKLQNILIKPSVDEETKTLEAAIAKPTDRDVVSSIMLILHYWKPLTLFIRKVL